MSWGMAGRSGGRKSPSEVQGQSPDRGPGRSPPKAEANCEINITFSCRECRI